MTGILTGGVSGDSRKAIIEKATGLAEVYFGTICVSVRLHDEQPTELVRSGTGETVRVGFEANFRAQEHHRVETPAYGPARCARCGRDSWPHAPLPQAEWDVG